MRGGHNDFSTNCYGRKVTFHGDGNLSGTYSGARSSVSPLNNTSGERPYLCRFATCSRPSLTRLLPDRVTGRLRQLAN